MNGLLKGKSAGTQFLILIGITLGSFFILGLIGTLILSRITGVGISEMSDVSKWNAGNPGIITVIRGMQVVQFLCLFLIPSIICARLYSTNPAGYLGLKRPYNRFYYLAGAFLLLVAIPLTGLLGEWNRQVSFPSGIEEWMKQQEEEAAKTIKLLLSKHTVKDLLLNIFFIAGLAAVGEELLFRGMVQRILTRWFRSPWIAITVAAFLFSAMHVQFYGFLPRFVLGILLGALYWYSGSLWTAMLAHFVYDAFLIIVVYNNPASLQDENAISVRNMAMAAAVSFVAMIGLLYWMRKNTRSKYPDAYAEDFIPPKEYPF
jgi:membrane protease YdiL (CAAX protease family)